MKSRTIGFDASRKNLSKAFLLVPILLLTVCATPVFAKNDEELLPSNKREHIIASCNTIKNSLKKIQRDDSKIRVTLGTTYNTIITKYITPLNLSLVKNNQANTKLNTIQTDFASKREKFNSQFIAYSKELEKLIDIDCRSNPDIFYKQLQAVRKERTATSELAASIKSLINSHLKEVTTLKDNLGKDKNGK